MPRCDFNKVALQLYGNYTSAWLLSCKFALYFQNSFSEKHLWRAAFEAQFLLIWSEFENFPSLDSGLVPKIC